MRTRFFILMVLACALQLSCGGMEAAPADSLEMTSWPDAVDLGVVVASEVDPSADIPPPPAFEFDR
jgi:hypothetical protein